METLYLASINENGVAHWFNGWVGPGPAIPSFKPVEVAHYDENGRYQDTSFPGQVLSESMRKELEDYMDGVTFIRLS